MEYPGSHALGHAPGGAIPSGEGGGSRTVYSAWPRGDRLSRRCFERLKQAHVNARYSPHYDIGDEELRWIAARVAELQTLVKAVCERRLAAG